MFIGNILATDYTRPLPNFINLVTTTESLIEGLPTLIVGKTTATELYGKSKVRILNRSISDNITWCYSLREKADDYEMHVDELINKSFDNVRSKTEYRYINLELTDYCKFKNLLAFIRYNKNRKTIFVNNKHIYLYEEGKNMVIGLSISEAEYLGVSEDRVKRILYSNKANIFYRDFYKLDFSIKKLLGNDIWMVPYVFSC